MYGCILDLIKKYGHPTPQKLQYFPHKHCPIYYGAKQEMVQPAYNSPPFDDKGIKSAQGVLGALLYLGRSVNKKLLVALSTIGYQ